MKNQAILKYFSWVDKIKYFTGMASFVFFALLTGDPEEGTTFLNNFSEHPWFLVWAIVLAILTFLLHKLMDYLIWYNTKRPHWSLKLLSPVDYLIKNNYLSRMCWTNTGVF